MNAPRLLLASTSRYRAELLGRLGLAFDTLAPDVDESARPGEVPHELARRLARAKAASVMANRSNTLAIGSDQVAELDGRAIGKPADLPTARAQLRAASRRTLAFHTAVCVIDGRDARERSACDTTRVQFRALDDAEIERYLAREPALDCAGSFMCGGLGISLFERIDSRDPTALVGLPLIALAGLLRDCGLAIP